MNQAIALQKPPAGREFDLADLDDSYRRVRQTTESLCKPLVAEDYVIQSMPDASPVKWHLAHSTWFFETFILKPHLSDYQLFHPMFPFLFNSYYQSVGPRWPRPQRGLLSRPTVAEVYRYRAHVDDHISRLLRLKDAMPRAQIVERLLLGINHEQQHQELIVTDLKHAWAANPLYPVYCAVPDEVGPRPQSAWITFTERLAWIGHEGAGFAFDNEMPRHRVFLPGFQIANRPATNSDYLTFMDDRGYERPELWLSSGWEARQTNGWNAPLYWERQGAEVMVVGLAGLQPLRPEEPVCHISYYEADAFARWAGARLPTEAEWEFAGADQPLHGHFLEEGRFQPAAAPAQEDVGPLCQLFGDVWQWTASPYVGYPGFRTAPGALGEYNGKFMCNQLVLRGASCATPRSHARRTYRNFFSPEARWQFTGLRLAKDLT